MLQSAGRGVEHLVKINTFLTDRNQVANRAIRRRILQSDEPASRTVALETVEG